MEKQDTKQVAIVEKKTGLSFDLNPRQSLFCEYYASDKEFFGNGVESYMAVYEPDQTKPNWYKTSCTRASQLLSNVKVSQYINHLLEMRGLNDAFVDKQLEFLVTQHADFKAKLGGIKEYNQLRKRVDSRPQTLVLNNVQIIVKRNGTKAINV